MSTATAELDTCRRHRLEMGGYCAGRAGAGVCYRAPGWSDAEAAAYRDGWLEGRRLRNLLEPKP